MDIVLGYDRLGGRLRDIGGTAVSYDRLGSRVSRVGEWDLRYDQLGGRLREIGGARVEYDRLGSRPRQLGDWELGYDHLGTRLVRVGPYAIGYDRLNRPSTVGPIRLGYKGIGWHPRTAQAPAPLGDGDLLALFFVLYHGEVARGRRAGGSAGAMQA